MTGDHAIKTNVKLNADFKEVNDKTAPLKEADRLTGPLKEADRLTGPLKQGVNPADGSLQGINPADVKQGMKPVGDSVATTSKGDIAATVVGRPPKP